MSKKTDFPKRILVGPALLLCNLILLFVALSPQVAYPIWFFWTGLSLSLSLGITILTLLELNRKPDPIAGAEKSEALKNMRALVDETQALYREKVDRLEEEVSSREAELGAMGQSYEQLKLETVEQKRRISDLQTSLEDALEELGISRQLQYLGTEGKKQIPKDLVQQHAQLRSQFDEKTLILEQTRRRLFEMEGHLFAQRLKWGEGEDGDRALLSILEELESENEELSVEVQALEELISSLWGKRVSLKSKKKMEQMLEFNFDAPMTRG